MSEVKVQAVRDRVRFRQRVTVQEAARRLGVKDDAVRKRIQRGTLDHEKDPDGRVYVFLDQTQDVSEPLSHDGVHHPTGRLSLDNLKDESKDKTINVLEDQIQYLREIIETRDRELEVRAEELRRRDTIIMSLAQRVPELSPASSPEDLGSNDGLVSSSGGAKDMKDGNDPQVISKRPWWRRVFG